MYKKTGGEERIGERPSKAKGAMLSGNRLHFILQENLRLLTKYIYIYSRVCMYIEPTRFRVVNSKWK